MSQKLTLLSLLRFAEMLTHRRSIANLAEHTSNIIDRAHVIKIGKAYELCLEDGDISGINRTWKFAEKIARNLKLSLCPSCNEWVSNKLDNCNLCGSRMAPDPFDLKDFREALKNELDQLLNTTGLDPLAMNEITFDSDSFKALAAKLGIEPVALQLILLGFLMGVENSNV